MISASILRTIYAGLMLAIGQVCSATADDATSWSIRGVADLPAATAIALGKNSEPIWFTVEAARGSKLSEVVNHVCGTQPSEAMESLNSEALRLNRAVSMDEIVQPGETVAVPFCLRVDRNIPVRVQPGDSPQQILLEAYGVSGPKTLRRFYELNARQLGFQNPREMAKRLQVGAVVTVPWASEARIFNALPNSAVTLPEILAAAPEAIRPQISNSLQPLAGPEPRPPHRFDVIDSVDLDSVSQNCSTGERATDSDFLATISLRFSTELSNLKKITGGSSRNITVGIIDSGVDTHNISLMQQQQFLAPNEEELTGSITADDDENDFVDDIYGMNFNNRTGFFNTYPTSGRIRSHGTKMATLILGGPRLAGTLTWNQGSPLVRLKIVNFASSTTTDANVGPEFLGDAIAYLKDQNVKIVNMSLSNARNIRTVSLVIAASADQLFVVAAGNARNGNGHNLSFDPLVFPARYGGRIGQHRDRVVTVAASDSKGRLAPFSNFSDQFVDLVAPGCAIETFDETGNTVLDTGTSPATAFVSFVSGLVMALGIDEPAEVKNRLLVATDFDPNLKAAAWSSGRLNAVKAISIRSDVVDIGGINYIYGRIDDRDALRALCSEPAIRTNLNGIRKVVPNVVGDSDTMVEFWVEVDSILQRIPCRQENRDAVELPTIGGQRLPDLSTIKDIVLSSR